MEFAFRESLSEFRELLRECPGTLRELREWLLHSENVFPAIGVVPTLLNNVGNWIRGGLDLQNRGAQIFPKPRQTSEQLP